MKCLILAAGYATRLYPLTENFPKPLLKVGDKTILDWLVDDIASTSRADGYVVVTNHKFVHFFEEWAALKQEQIKTPVIVVDDGTSTNENRLGAVRDILFALEQTGIQDDLFIMAGDNVLDFSLDGFLTFAQEKGTSCVMCHEEQDLSKLQKTAVITFDQENLITSYEEKPAVPKGCYAVPPFYYYRAEDAGRISEALQEGCGADAPGSFAAWLSTKTLVHAWEMTGKRYDIGDLKSYEGVQRVLAEE
ncbi:MAG: NTP transferase domain-containing protein [Lachnospiraceae bacterium]|nr:NTP transferase domain-containing protein [Lachnospiraceae bacterium]